MPDIELADYVIREYRALCYRIAAAIRQWEKAPDEVRRDIALIRMGIGLSKDKRERLASVREVYKIEPDAVYASLENSLSLLEEGKLADAGKELGDLRKSIEDKINAASRAMLA